MYSDLAKHLSSLGGKVSKEGAIIRAPAPVLLARGPAGPAIKLPGVFSTRCATIDAAIGRGGIPMGRMTVLASEEAGGKTTIALHTCAEAIAMGGVAIYLDNEHKLDLDYAAALGVPLDKLLISQPGTIEDALSIYNETVLRVQEHDPNIPVLGILDSINASKSENEYEEDGTADMTSSNSAGLGAQARIMSDRLPKIARLISNRKAALLMISQPREIIGGYGHSKNLVAGGSAPKFYAALVIELRRLGFWEESGKKIGSKMLAKMVKNQVSAPFKEAEFFIRWGAGIDGAKALLDHCIKMTVLSSGANGWIEMVDPKDESKIVKWQGVKGWHKIAMERPDIVQFLTAKSRSQYANS